MRTEAVELNLPFYEAEAEQINPKITALEGPVCAGKTTLLDNLRKQGVQTIREYSEYVDSATRNFPKFPPINDEVARDSFKFFLDLEIARRRDRDLLVNSDHLVLDRSIYTLMAFEAGATKFTGIDILSWAIEYLKEKSNRIILPGHILYIDTPAVLSRKRAAEGRIRLAEFLLTDQFNEGFRSFFLALKQIKPGFITFVDGNKDEETLLIEARKTLGFKDSF